MVVAAALTDVFGGFVIRFFDQVAAPLLGSAAAPARDFVINVLPIVFGGLGGAGWGIMPWA